MDTRYIMNVCVFFFSSRRRHTRLQGYWSSDVCSSDLRSLQAPRQALAKPRRNASRWRATRSTALADAQPRQASDRSSYCPDRKSVVKGKRVDLGGGGIIK